MNHITSQIYIGTAVEAECVVNGTMDGINGPGDSQIGAIVNVGRYESYTVPRKCKIEYNKIALRQGANKDNVAMMAGAFCVLDYYTGKGVGVLVHCRSGYVRSPAVVCLWLMINRDMEYAEAMHYVKDKHKMGDRMQTIIERARDFVLYGIS